jgi:beta-galactosidase
MLRANGINLVQTYVFWDIHEPEQGVWNFPSDPDSNYGNYIISLHKKNMDIDFFPS